ncbi:MAG: hypothetical protein RJA83_1063, partial [Pseudomonadota bacterium]
YFETINKENVTINQNQRNAFSYLMKLTVKKYRRPSDFINQVFPDYIEPELTMSESAWLIVRLFYIFISWFNKPKSNLKHFSDAEKFLSAVRIAQDPSCAIERNEEFNDALDIIVIKFLHDEKIVSPSSYIPINKTNLSEEWEAYKNNPSHQFDCLDIDNLLHCLASRIRSLRSSEEKNYLFIGLPALKDFVYKKDLSSFKEKSQEIMNFLKKNSSQQNIEVIQSIKNISLKIIQRLYILNKKSLVNENIYLTNNLIKEKIEKMKFYYEAYRANWEKSYGLKATTTNYYEILNSLENVLYDVCYIRNIIGVAENTNVQRFKDILQRLENFSGNVILKNLSEDMIDLSNFISEEMSFFQPEEIEESNQINLVDAAEWDDESNISETPNVEQLEQEESLNTEEVSTTKLDSQSDSGISENEVEFQNLSGQSRILTYESRPAFFVRSTDQAENSNIIRRSFRNSYHG